MKKKKHYTDTHNPVPWLFDAHKRQLFFFSLVITFFFSFYLIHCSLLKLSYFATVQCAAIFFLSFHFAPIAQCSSCAMFTLVFQVFQSNHMQFSPVRISQALFSWQFYFKLLLNVIVLLCLFVLFCFLLSFHRSGFSLYCAKRLI